MPAKYGRLRNPLFRVLDIGLPQGLPPLCWYAALRGEGLLKRKPSEYESPRLRSPHALCFGRVDLKQIPRYRAPFLDDRTKQEWRSE